MKFYRILTFAVIAAISASFVACSDDDDDADKFDSKVLPTSIKTTEGADVETITFTYEPIATPKAAATTAPSTRIKTYSVNGSVYTIEYALTGNDIQKVTNGDDVYTYEYSSSPKATAPSVKTITKKINGEVDAVYTINSQGLLVSEKEDDDRSLYEYSGKNLTKGSETSLDGKTVYSKFTAWYGNNSGIFRNVTTPQWFLISEFENVAIGQTANNVSKGETIDYETVGGKAVEEKTASSFTYVWLRGFPTKIDASHVTTGVDAAGKATEGTTTSNTIVTYNIAK